MLAKKDVGPHIGPGSTIRRLHPMRIDNHSRAITRWASSVRRARLNDLLIRNAVVAGGYAVVALGVKWYFQSYAMWPAPLWLPSAVSMYAALRIGTSCWPGIFLGSLATNTFGFGEPVGISAAVSIGNTLGPILAASLMEKRVRIADPFSRVGECVAFSAGVVLMGAISAMIGATAVALELPRGAQIEVEHWLNWMISDVGAVLLLTPLLLLLNGRQRLLSQMRQHFPEFCIAVFITLVMISYLVGDTHSGNTGAAFLILVPLLWLAVRFSLAVAYPIFVGTIGIITAMSLSGYGPFSLNGQVGSQFLFAQMSLGFSISILLLGGAATEQRAAEMALRELNGELENRVHQRTAQLLESQAQLEKAALHDPLTGLPNRRLLEERFSFCESLARRKRHQFSILLIDLDHFKKTNDDFGHDAGDALLIEVARRLRTSVRACDLVGRMGGDEFMVLIPDTGQRASIDSICCRIRTALGVPVELDDHQLHTAPSIGIAVFPDHGTSWQQVYKSADIALYDVKRQCRGVWKWYGESAPPPLQSIEQNITG